MKNNRYSLLSNFQVKGVWWLPQSPENQIPGALKYKKSKHIRLELLGEFTARNSSETRVDIILGETFDHKPLTMVHALFTGPSIQPLRGARFSTYESYYVVIGAHYSNIDEIRFPQLAVSFTHLEEWLKFKPIREGIKFDNAGLELDLTVPSKLTFNFPLLNATLETHYGFSIKHDRKRKASMQATAYFKITPNTNNGFEWFIEQFHNIGNFLSLLIGKPVYIKRIKFQGETEDYRDDGIDILFVLNKTIEPNFINPRAILITKDQVENELETILNKWIEKQDSIKTIFNLYMGILYNPYPYRVTTFLNLTQALESFQRHLNTDKYITEDTYTEAYNQIIAAIPADLPKELIERLKGSLKYGNEFSLRTRLKNLLRSLEENLLMLITDNINDMVQAIVNTRNYYTHYDKSLKERSATGRKLADLNEKLKALLLIILFKEICIDSQIVETAIERFLNPPFFYFPDID